MNIIAIYLIIKEIYSIKLYRTQVRLRFVPRNKRIKGQYLYKGSKERMTGAYYISKGAARRVIDYVKRINVTDRLIGYMLY